jgi:hypothetical protein
MARAGPQPHKGGKILNTLDLFYTPHSPPGLIKFLKYLNYKKKRIWNTKKKKWVGWRRAARHDMLTRQVVRETEGLAV